MTEDLKLIVIEVNKLLKTDYNLISFDSLSTENLLQVLINVLCELDALSKFEVKELDPEETNKRIMDGLRNIQYRPNIDPNDPGEFRRALVHAEKKTVYPILRWIFENKERIRQVAYLAKFLIPLSLPPEAMAMPEISNLWSQYEMAMEEFKETHKTHQTSEKEGHKTRELKNDIGAIEAEIENVKKRIERTQTRLDKVPQQELFLESAHNLRVEKERQKELQAQLEEQKQGFQRATIIQERMQKELQSARISTQGTSPEQLMEGLIEETQVFEFMITQKLPQELLAKQAEINILQNVLDEPSISREYLLDLQMKVDEVNKEVQQMVESRMAQRDTQNDTLAPFRQQASMVARNKAIAVEQLDQATKELHEVDESLQTKQMKLEETVGEVILRGDELKQYVNTLRAKSSLYKQQRQELATLKSEVTDLEQTLENLKTQDPTLSASLSESTPDDNNSSLDSSISRPDSPVESRGMAELTRLVDGLSRAVTAARDRVTPMSQQLRPLRERVTDLKDERDSKKQNNLKKPTLIHQTSKKLKNMAKINLLTLLNESVAKPIKKFIKKEIKDLRREKMKSEFHVKPNQFDSKTYIKESDFKIKNKENVETNQQMEAFIKRHNPSQDMIDDIIKIMQRNGIYIPECKKEESMSVADDEQITQYIDMSAGRYVHFGVERYLKKILDMNGIKPQDENNMMYMDLAIYILKSKQDSGIEVAQYLVIFGRPAGGFYKHEFKEPFVIGVYRGLFPTPTIGNEILRPFVDEMFGLQQNNIYHNGLKYSIIIRAVVCDPIANSLVTCVTLPDSLFGCSKCNLQGKLQFDHGITSYPDHLNGFNLRSDKDFLEPEQIAHHTGIPIFNQLKIGLITQVFIDYKYTVCLGVMKRLMTLWMKGKLDYRLNNRTLENISDELSNLENSMPQEFKRKPKRLDDFDNWDSYDLRQFLLYYGPVVLHNKLSRDYYFHFLHLNLALRIMINPDNQKDSCSEICSCLLKKFVSEFSRLYGSDLIDYNIHNILHLDDIILKSYSIDSVGGFLYDKQMDLISNEIRKNDNSLENLAEKILENTNMIYENNKNLSNMKYPYVDENSNLICRSAILSKNEPDNYAITKNGDIIIIEDISMKNNEIIIMGKIANNLILCQTPLTIQKLMLMTTTSSVEIFKLNDIKAKAVKISTTRGDFIFPLLTPS